MWNRACPMCFVKLSPFLVLSHSNDIVCSACHARLELSRHSRVFSSFAGIVSGMLAFHLLHSATPLGFWALPVVATILAFGFGSALPLFFYTDLVVHASKHPTFPHPCE